jgi:hypothetical protein
VHIELFEDREEFVRHGVPRRPEPTRVLARHVEDALDAAGDVGRDLVAGTSREVVKMTVRVIADLVTVAVKPANGVGVLGALEVAADGEERPVDAQLAEEVFKAGHGACVHGVGRSTGHCAGKTMDCRVTAHLVEVDGDRGEALQGP